MKVHYVFKTAGQNLANLYEIVYFGRMLIIGRTVNGELVVIYIITGRSEGSQNRRFIETPDGGIGLEVADDDLEKGDPELTLYNATMRAGKKIIVTNGKQTDLIARGLSGGKDIFETMSGDDDLCMYESDHPHFTPRISATAEIVKDVFEGKIIICRKSFFGDGVFRSKFDVSNCARGFGFGISTYADNAKGPLPPFVGEPLILPIVGNAAEIADEYWAMASKHGFETALGVQVSKDDGSVETEIRNRHEAKAD